MMHIKRQVKTIQISTIILSTEAEGLRELAQHVVLPNLVKGEWPRRCDFISASIATKVLSFGPLVLVNLTINIFWLFK